MKGKSSDKADQPLAGCAVAVMVASGFEETEMTEPQRALLKAGASLQIVSPDQGLVNGWHGKSWGHFFPVDRQIGAVLGSDFDMLLLPGGERSITKLIENPHSRRIIGHFFDAGKPIAAIDHGVRLLAISQKLKGHRVTGPQVVRETIEGNGADWIDEAVVVDGNLVTARNGGDLSTFVDQLVRVFANAGQVKKAA